MLTQVRVSSAFVHAATPLETRPTAKDFRAIWDTGATATCITRDIVEACGLMPVGVTQIHTANGVRQTETFLVNITLPNGFIVENVTVAMTDVGPGADALIGMDIITQGDFAVTNRNGTTVFSFRMPSVVEFDFVKETELLARAHAAAPKQTPGHSFHGKGKRHK